MSSPTFSSEGVPGGTGALLNFAGRIVVTEKLVEAAVEADVLFNVTFEDVPLFGVVVAGRLVVF